MIIRKIFITFINIFIYFKKYITNSHSCKMLDSSDEYLKLDLKNKSINVNIYRIPDIKNLIDDGPIMV